VAREAFARARRFLNYNHAAALGALAASVSLGIFVILLLALLGLFTDAVVEKGQIALANAEQEKEAFTWLGEVIGNPEEADRLIRQRGENGLGLISLAWRSRGRWYEPLFTGPVGWFAWTRANGSYLTGLMLLAVVVVVLRCLVTFAMHALASTTVIEASTRLRRAVYHQTYRTGTLAVRAIGSSEPIGIFTRQLEAVHDGLYRWLTVTFREPATFIALLLFALMIEAAASGGVPWLSLAFILFAALVWLVGGQLAAYFRRQERLNVRRSAEQLALLQESLRMMRLVKVYLMELFNQARIERQLAGYARSLHERNRAQVLFRQALVFLGLLAAIVLLFAAGWNIVNGNLSLASTLTMSIALLSLYGPAWNWWQQRRTLRRAHEAAEGLFDFLDRRGDVGQVVGAEFLPPMSKQLEFNNVTLREPGTGRLLLEQVSLQIPAGQRIALVGQEDLEKHALVYLIPRFLDPNEGEIRFDGRKIPWVTLESLRVQVALVMQHNLIFNDTVANNIGCGDPGYKLPQVIEAAKTAHAHHFIQHLPAGYDTVIGEMGHRLNVAEQFRIALARAILRDPALVIIEEPLTVLDDDTKALIDDTYARFLPGRTVIFLPHRLTTIRSCSRIFLLNKGRLEAAGDHRELLRASELYRHLQYLEFNVFAEHAEQT
jgi:ATP-binding cassette subfamily B protein